MCTRSLCTWPGRIRLPDPAWTSELRRRYLGLLLDGLAANEAAPRPPLPALHRGRS
ncbi:MAG TPA: hypothetical protein VE464_05655 [Streptosporangiaceae bacterium]|nr:hypothetical protein [Streptosporangiaceae bacterium]